MEDMPEGSLLSLLHSMNKTLKPKQFMMMSLDVCSGMAYLESMKVIHRDLACRNPLVTKASEKYVIKVADFGMSIDTTYQSSGKEKPIPIRWSYGVTCWEMYTYGTVPYSSKTNDEVIELVKEGNRLTQPETCPDEVYQLWTRCWAVEPVDRPSFAEILDFLNRIHQQSKDTDISTQEEVDHVYQLTKTDQTVYCHR